MTELKVAFISVRTSFRDGDSFWIDEGNGRLMLAMQKHYPELTVMVYEQVDKLPIFTCEVKPKNLFTVPWVGGYPGAWHHRKTIWNTLKKVQEEHDVLIIQWPFHAFWLLPRLKKPIVTHMCTDVISAAENPKKYGGWKRLPAKWLSHYMMHCLHKSLRKTKGRVVANGDESASRVEEFNPISVVSSSIWPDEILSEYLIKQKFDKQKSNQGPRIIFVGRPTLDKGTDILIEALSLLLQEKMEFSVDFAGATKEVFFEHLINVGIDSELLARLNFRGEVPFGPDLFSIFDAADILILPSRFDGTPRVLIEARARGCVVIGSKVGGIPASIESDEDGILLEPEDITGISESIRKVWNEDEFRLKLMLQGRKKITSITLDDYAQPFVDSVSELLRKHE